MVAAYAVFNEILNKFRGHFHFVIKIENFLHFRRAQGLAEILLRNVKKLHDRFIRCVSETAVNPINSVMIEKTGRLSLRKEEDVRTFNDRIKTSLDDYTYIDSYSWLMQNGFGTSNGVNGKDSSEDDGLHYTVKTYKRIYDYCLRYINAH